MQKKVPDYIGAAVITALILMVEDLIGGFAHLRFESWFKWVYAVILITALIIFCIQFSKQRPEGVTFGNVFGFGFKITAIVALLMVLFTFLSINFIFPEMRDQVIEKARSEMEAKGSYSEEMIDRALGMTRKFFLPFAFLAVIIGTFIYGIIGSLLGAAFAKKTEPSVFQNKP